MEEVSVEDYFSTDRNFTVSVVSSNRELIKVPPYKVVMDHSPNTGKRLGILVEGESTNHFPDSEGMVIGVQKSSNVSIINESLAGSPSVARFPRGRDGVGYIGSDVNINSDYIAVSFYIKLTASLLRPRLLSSEDTKSSFVIELNNEEYNPYGIEHSVEGPMRDLSFRVRMLIPTSGRTISNIKIKSAWNSRVGFDISRIQIEESQWSSYIPTKGTAVTRPADTVYRNLTHGIDINQKQGTIDVVFTATPNAEGSAMVLRNSDWSTFLAIGNRKDPDGYPEVIRFHDEHTSLRTPLQYHNREVEGKYRAVRVSYSGYGVRGSIYMGNEVVRLKDYDSFNGEGFVRMQFGESYEGQHFFGHIHLINMYARTFNDEELLEITYTPNEGSIDIPKDGEDGDDELTRMALTTYVAWDTLTPPNPFIAVTEGDSGGNVVYDGGFPKIYNGKSPNVGTPYESMNGTYKYMCNAIEYATRKGSVASGHRKMLAMGDALINGAYPIKSTHREGFLKSMQVLAHATNHSLVVKDRSDWGGYIDVRLNELLEYDVVFFIGSDYGVLSITEESAKDFAEYRRLGGGIILLTDHGPVLDSIEDVDTSKNTSGFFVNVNKVARHFGAWFSGNYNRSSVNVGFLRDSYIDHELYNRLSDRDYISAGRSESEVKIDIFAFED